MRQRDKEGERCHKEENKADCKIRWKEDDEKKARELKAKLDPKILKVLDNSYGISRLYEEVKEHKAREEQEGYKPKKNTKSVAIAGRIRDGHCDSYGYPRYTYYYKDTGSSPQEDDNLSPLEKKLLSHSAHTSDLSSDPAPWSRSETEGENDSEENNSVEDHLLSNITPTSGNKSPIKEVEKSDDDDDDTASDHSEGRSSSCSFLDSSDSSTTIDSSPMSEKELSGQSSYGSSHCSPTMVSPSSMSGMSLRDSSMETSLSTIPGSFEEVPPRRTKRRDADDDDIEVEEQDFSPKGIHRGWYRRNDGRDSEDVDNIFKKFKAQHE
ncbi:hypothetical protein Pmani_035797 [Petrolisthes manimaculis]|uniref:Uncharacterized protein n=1 Tax=Petrolisthes manimaculis TaxID=1843537 RepID=A0AAE1NJV4_9EUCA|nr:hypothetical protein Pmani_035797 [Petrolisthes manimaculis]